MIASASDPGSQHDNSIERLSYHDRHAFRMRHLHNIFKVWHIVPGIANALEKYRFRFVVDQFLKLLRLVSVYKFGRYS